MLHIDENVMWKWKDRLCAEMEDVCADGHWTEREARAAKALLSSMEKIFCIVKCARELDGE